MEGDRVTHRYKATFSSGFFIGRFGMHFASSYRITTEMERGIMWQAWMTGVLGVWLIIASFTINGNIMNELIVGVTIAILGFWSAARIQI